MKDILQKGSLAFAVLFVLVVPSANVFAADYSYDSGWIDTGYYDYAQPSYDYSYGSGWIDTGYYDYAQPTYSYDSGWIDTGYYDYAQPTYSNSTPSYSHSTPTVYTYSAPSSQYQYQTQQQQQSQTSTNNNTNVNNNNVVVNVPTYTPPVQYCPSGYSGTYPNCVAPAPVYPTPICTLNLSQTYIAYNNYNNNQAITLSWSSSNANSGFISNGIGSVGTSGSRVVNINTTTTFTGTFYGQNGQSTTCSATVSVASYVPPVYPTTPYVTLSQVPYTGLDLGPVGTFLYWSFLVLFCLVAAYLIAIKKAQIGIARALGNFLFGSNTAITSSPAHAVAHNSAVSQSDLDIIVNTIRSIIEGPSKASSHTSHAAHTVAKKEDAVDDFIVSQITRTRHA